MTIFVKNADLKLPERHSLDRYDTPAWLAEMALDLVGGSPAKILDPGCGAGTFAAACRARWPSAYITGVEIDRKVAPPPACNYWLRGDFLHLERIEQYWLAPARYSLVIGNPPYVHAEPFVRRGLDLLDFGGRLIYLLRLTFLESKVRAEGLFREHPPFAVHVCPRVHFAGCGENSPYASALFEWRAGWQGETRITWPSWERRKKGTAPGPPPDHTPAQGE